MKYEYEPGKKYTADELEDIMRAGWKSDEDYLYPKEKFSVVES